ncbi:hypothetical protein ACYARM_002405 [Vibrio alginolyticus]
MYNSVIHSCLPFNLQPTSEEENTLYLPMRLGYFEQLKEYDVDFG